MPGESYEKTERKTMDEFLRELKDLLEKHNAAIIRSANSTHDLVVAVQTDPGVFKELTFAEEITESSIKYKWYS